MKQLPLICRTILQTALLCALLGGMASAQTGAESFFSHLYRQEPQSWYPLSDENSGKYEEKIQGGRFVTRQSFMLADPYASGKDRYLIPLEAREMESYLPGVSLFRGEMSCNLEFNAGKLPFLGFADADGAAYFVMPSYDVPNATFLALMARVDAKDHKQQEKFAVELVRLFAQLRLRKDECHSEILDFGKAQTKWAGDVLNLRMGYNLECRQEGSVEWGPKMHFLDLELDFSGGHLKGIMAKEWP